MTIETDNFKKDISLPTVEKSTKEFIQKRDPEKKEKPLKKRGGSPFPELWKYAEEHNLFSRTVEERKPYGLCKISSGCNKQC